jgi:hypothetical protein
MDNVTNFVSKPMDFVVDIDFQAKSVNHQVIVAQLAGLLMKLKTALLPSIKQSVFMVYLL